MKREAAPGNRNETCTRWGSKKQECTKREGKLFLFLLARLCDSKLMFWKFLWANYPNKCVPIYGGGKFTPFGQAFSTFLCAISADFSLPPLLSLTPKWSDGNYETQGANTALTHISSAPHKSSAVPCSKEKGVLYFGWHAAVLVLVLPTTWPNGINLQKHNIFE